MKSPFSYLRDFWNQTKPDKPDDSAVPNRAAFRAMGIKGRRGAKLIKQRIGQTLDMDAHDEYRWVGQRIGKFFGPRIGRSIPVYSHQQHWFESQMRRQAGAATNRRWLLKKIEARRAAQGIPTEVSIATLLKGVRSGRS